MAQLPPKVPMSMSHWPMNNAFGDHDFTDFAATRRGSHRRSASDSVAFIEPFININDEDQLMMMSCMFSAADDVSSNAVPPDLSSPSSGPSSPSDNNGMMMDMIIGDGNNIINDIFSQHPKAEPGEAESDPHAPSQPLSPGSDSVFDPKRVKRILANRQSAQRSRVRKLQYISELERGVTSLQSEVSALSPRVAFLDHQRLILNVDNSALKQRIAALAQDKIFKDAHQEALKKEIERLRQVYHHQNLKKMTNQNSQDHPNSDEAMACTDKDLIPN